MEIQSEYCNVFVNVFLVATRLINKTLHKNDNMTIELKKPLPDF